MVKRLEEEVLRKDEVNKTLTDKIEKRNTLDMEQNSWTGGQMCSYWNMGFCRDKKVWKFTNSRKYCEKYIYKRECGDEASTKSHIK